MALTNRQEHFFRHRFWVYRGNAAPEDPLGNPVDPEVPVIAVPVPELQDLPCRLAETSQFDVRKAPGISINQDTIMTADELRFERIHDVRGKDYIKVVTDVGATLWYRAAGEAKTKGPRANSAHIFLQRTPPPIIA